MSIQLQIFLTGLQSPIKQVISEEKSRFISEQLDRNDAISRVLMFTSESNVAFAIPVSKIDLIIKERLTADDPSGK